MTSVTRSFAAIRAASERGAGSGEDFVGGDAGATRDTRVTKWPFSAAMIATTSPVSRESVHQRVGNRPAGVGGVRCGQHLERRLGRFNGTRKDETGLGGAFAEELAVLIPDEIAQHHGGSERPRQQHYQQRERTAATGRSACS